MDTNFSSLPIVLQLNILRKLTWDDSKNARLVSTIWLRMINYIKKPVVVIREKELLGVVMNSTYEKISQIAIGSLKYPLLPIYSTSRIMLPRVIWLNLYCGNSKENILKLIRYYLPTCCEGICFWSLSLSNIESYHLSSKIEYNNLNRFGFSLDLVVTQQHHITESDDLKHIIQLTKHLKLLAHFLRSVKFKNLQYMMITIIAKRDFDDEPLLPPNYIPSLNLCLNSFNDSLQVFIKENGEKLKYLFIRTPALCWIDNLQHVINVNILELKITRLDRTVGFNFSNDFVQSICGFKKLEVVTCNLKGVGISHGIKAMKLLLKNNQDSLKDVKVIGLDETNDLYLDWLYLSHDLLKLTDLELDLNSCFDVSIKKAFSLNYKIESLQRLILDWWVEDEESEECGLKWMIQIAPNLKRLELTLDPIFKLNLASIFKLIKSLHKLEFIQLCSAIYGQEDDLLDEDEDGEIISPEVERWFLDNKKDEICGEWTEDEQYFKIWIRQPLDESHYPQ